MPEDNKLTEAPQQAVAVQRAPLREMLSLLKDAGPSFVEAYARDIIEREVAQARFDHNWRIARVFADSGLFTDSQAVSQAMTKIQLGESWNMPAADAMQHVYFVKGRPAVQNEYLAAKMRDAGLDWEIEWHRDGEQCTGCTLWPSRLQTDGSWKPIMDREKGQMVPAHVTFTRPDAERAGLLKNDTYKNYADDMYFWRCIARLRRRYATNVLCGVMTRDEAQEIPENVNHADSATRENTAGLAEKLHAARQLTAASELTPNPTPVQSAGAVLPVWTDRNAMNAWLRMQRTRIGEAKCNEIFRQHDVLIASLRPDDPRAALIHADILAAAALGDDAAKV